jgi:hypothetical protein
VPFTLSVRFGIEVVAFDQSGLSEVYTVMGSVRCVPCRSNEEEFRCRPVAAESQSPPNPLLQVGRCNLKGLETRVDSAWFKRSTLNDDMPLSSFAFEFKLRRYMKGISPELAPYVTTLMDARNMSTVGPGRCWE